MAQGASAVGAVTGDGAVESAKGTVAATDGTRPHRGPLEPLNARTTPTLSRGGADGGWTPERTVPVDPLGRSANELYSAQA